MKFNKLKLFRLLIALIFLLITSRAYQNQALSFHFVDEEDNLVLGKYLLNGEKLYSDLFSHHQPLAYIMSSGVQQLTKPNTIFLLIKRHHEAIIAWSVFWSLLLVWRFGLPLLLTVVFYEPIKIYLLGHLFLSESLVVYPFIYLLSYVFLSTGLPSKREIFFLSLCFSLSFLLLSPLWPVLLFLITYIFWKMKKCQLGRLGWLWLLGGAALPVFLVMFFISLPDYLYNAFYINFKYYIPITTSGSWLITIMQAVTSPLLTFTNTQNGNATMQLAKVLSGLLILNSIFLLKKGNYKIPLLMFLILGLSNIRFVPPGEQEYSGFHLLPWFSSLIILSSITSLFVWQKYSSLKVHLIILSLLIVAGLIVFRESQNNLFRPRNQALDFYINYSRQADFGQGIKILKTGNDSLFVVPDEWLIYWQADIKHASKMVNYYAWMSQVPEIKQPLHEIFTNDPPAFFYCDRCQFGYFGLEEFFNKYQRIKKNGQETSLMVLKEKISNITSDQLKQLSYYDFSFD